MLMSPRVFTPLEAMVISVGYAALPNTGNGYSVMLDGCPCTHTHRYVLIKSYTLVH